MQYHTLKSKHLIDIMKKYILVTISLFVLSTCYPLTASGSSFDDIEIPNSIDDYKSHVFNNGYFVTFENKGGENWHINRISTLAPDTSKRKDTEEIVFVNNDFKIVRPFFVNANIEFNILYGRIWHCNKSSNYDICRSYFGSRFIAVRKLDTSKIIDVIKQTNMFGEIASFKINSENDAIICRNNSDKITNIMSKIKIDPIYEDMSGLYNNENIIRLNMYKIQKCPIDLNRDVLKLTLSDADSDFNIQINPKEYSLSYKADGHIIRPNVRVLSKNINKYILNESFKNSDIEIIIKEIEINKLNNIDIAVDVINKSTKYVNLSDISIYVDDSILTINYNLDLPPKALKRNVALSFNGKMSKNIEVLRVYDEVIAKLNKRVTKEVIKNDQLSIGVSVKYDVNKSSANLFDIRGIPIAKMLP